MNLRITLFDSLVNQCLLVRIVDLDNEGGDGLVKVYISGQQFPLEVKLIHLSLSPLDVFIPHTPITGSIHKVTAKLYAGELLQLHDTDTKMIKMA